MKRLFAASFFTQMLLSGYLNILQQMDSFLGLNKEFIIPYGIPDNYPRIKTNSKGTDPRILFVAVVRESKGCSI